MICGSCILEVSLVGWCKVGEDKMSGIEQLPQRKKAKIVFSWNDMNLSLNSYAHEVWFMAKLG